MPMTFDKLEQLLAEQQLNFHAYRDSLGALVHLPAGWVELVLVQDGAGLVARAPIPFSLDARPRRNVATEWIACRNTQSSIGRWGHDPVHEEVILDQFVPIGDGDLTGPQLMAVICAIAIEARNGLLQLARLGVEPSAIAPPSSGASGLPAGGSATPADPVENTTAGDDVLDPSGIPEGPIAEDQWMEIALRCLSQTASADAMARQACDPPQIERLMDLLFDLRRRSTQATGEPWTTVGLVEDHCLDAAAETMLLFLASRQVMGDARVLRAEAWGIVPASADPVDRDNQDPAGLTRLLCVGLAVGSDGGKRPPYRLSPNARHVLGALLPAAHEGE